LPCVAVCCSVLQCVAVCCSVLQCVAVCCSVSKCVAACCRVLQCVAVCRSALQCVAVFGSPMRFNGFVGEDDLALLQSESLGWVQALLQPVPPPVCCSVLQCVAVCCSVSRPITLFRCWYYYSLFQLQ